MSAYTVKLQKFEGPFELLINLIDKKKLSINEVSLSEVSNQYLDHLKEIENFPINEVASFIVIAATLMLIKSRSLLPSLQLTEEEETEIQDLEERLILYKKYQEITKGLEKIFGKQVIFTREPFAQIEEIFIEPSGLNTSQLVDALRVIIDRLPKKEILPEKAVKKTISLEQRINELAERLEAKVNFCFSEVTKNPECERIDVIVNFLAVLELVKRGFVMVRQKEGFGEIEIAKHGT